MMSNGPPVTSLLVVEPFSLIPKSFIPAIILSNSSPSSPAAVVAAVAFVDDCCC